MDRDPVDAGGESSDEQASPIDHACTDPDTDVQKRGSEAVTEGVEHMSLDEADEGPTIRASTSEAANDWPVEDENERLDQTVEARNREYKCTADLYNLSGDSTASPAANLKGKSRGGYTPET